MGCPSHHCTGLGTAKRMGGTEPLGPQSLQMSKAVLPETQVAQCASSSPGRAEVTGERSSTRKPGMSDLSENVLW